MLFKQSSCKHLKQNKKQDTQQTAPLAARRGWQSCGSRQSREACEQSQAAETCGDEDPRWLERWCWHRICLPLLQHLSPSTARSADDSATRIHPCCLWNSTFADRISKEGNKFGHVNPFVSNLTFEPPTNDLNFLHVHGSYMTTARLELKIKVKGQVMG